MNTNPKQTLKNKKMIIEKMKSIAESSLTTINDNLSNTYHSDVEWRGFYPLEDLKGLDEKTFLDVFDGVPQAEVEKAKIVVGLDMIGALAAETDFLPSNGEARRALKANSVAVNKEKVTEAYTLTTDDIINDNYVILNVGKKNTYILKVS